jgi:outer membrane assembly lipoprotein YfiO
MQKHIGWLFLVAGIVLAAAPVANAQWVWTPQTGRFVNVKRLPKETPELQIQYTRSLMLEGQYKKALRETQKFVEFYPDAPEADENQFLRGEIKLAQRDYMDAAKEFQQVITGYPDSQLFDAVIEKQYEIGDRYYELGLQRMARDEWYRFRPFRKKPFKHAIEVYSMVIDNQPFTAAAAEAQYKIGLCHYTRNEFQEAAFEYRRVIEDYAGSDWVDDAAYGLALCYHQQSLPPAYDQSPSYLTVDAIDMFAERYPTDPRLADLAPRRTEMVESIAQQRLETGRFYERRRLFDSARIYYELVVNEFPGTEAAARAGQWLAANPAGSQGT